MLPNGALVLASLILGVASASPIVHIQEQFGELSRSADVQLRDFRAENNRLRSVKLIHQVLNSLGSLSVEIRNISRVYWERVENHEYAWQCLEIVRPDFDNYVMYGVSDIQMLAGEMDQYIREDAIVRFNPAATYFQRENSQSVYRPVQTLAMNPFSNVNDTVYELQAKLDEHQNLREYYAGRLPQELRDIAALVQHVETRTAELHEAAVKYQHIFLELVLYRMQYGCYNMKTSRNAELLALGHMEAKTKEFKRLMTGFAGI